MIDHSVLTAEFGPLFNKLVPQYIRHIVQYELVKDLCRKKGPDSEVVQDYTKEPYLQIVSKFSSRTALFSADFEHALFAIVYRAKPSSKLQSQRCSRIASGTVYENDFEYQLIHTRPYPQNQFQGKSYLSCFKRVNKSRNQSQLTQMVENRVPLFVISVQIQITFSLCKKLFTFCVYLYWQNFCTIYRKHILAKM